jgi:DNA-binding LytR/AlgR family response regulator
MLRPNPAQDIPTAIVAEDEQMLADELVENLGALWPRLKVVARAADGVAALHAVEEHAPTIAFLDIHMPRLTGLDVARQISGRCHVAFITAFDQHALEAFEAGAVDYVLKPITTARLLPTVQRLKARVAETPPDLGHLLNQIAPRINRPAAAPYLQWISASRGAAVRLITVDEIQYFRADNKYTVVATADSEALIKKTIKELAEELDPTMFWRVHRSGIVNVHAIDSVVHDDRGNMNLRLKGRSERLPVAEQYHYLFRQM